MVLQASSAQTVALDEFIEILEVLDTPAVAAALENVRKRREHYAALIDADPVNAAAFRRECAGYNAHVLAGALVVDSVCEQNAGTDDVELGAHSVVQRALLASGMMEPSPPSPPPLPRGSAIASKGTSRSHQAVHRLADRDGWACYLCGCDLIDTCPGGAAPEVLMDDYGRRYIARDDQPRIAQREHVVPVALGGSNTDLNMALSCRPCNSKKGAQ